MTIIFTDVQIIGGKGNEGSYGGSGAGSYGGGLGGGFGRGGEHH